MPACRLSFGPASTCTSGEAMRIFRIDGCRYCFPRSRLGSIWRCAGARRRSGRHLAHRRQEGQGPHCQLWRRDLRRRWSGLPEPNDPETDRPKTDNHNTNASKQGRPLLGIPIVLSMKPSRRRQMGRPSLQRGGRQNLYRLILHDRPQHRRTQGLRHGRADLQSRKPGRGRIDRRRGGARAGERFTAPAGRTGSRALSDRGCRPRRLPRRGWQRRA